MDKTDDFDIEETITDVAITSDSYVGTNLDPIVHIKSQEIAENDEPNAIPKQSIQTVLTPITKLERACTASDVMGVVVDQINGLQNDIQDLEDLRNTLKNNLLSDKKSLA